MQLTDLPEISCPMPWQDRAWSQLNAQLAAGKLPHALLLAGSPATGKSRLALAIARLLLCAAPEDSLNCGHCRGCTLSGSGVHGDFRWLQPIGDSRFIRIDQIRGVVSFINQTATFGSRKVVVLSPAESMNLSAFNALLKSLEEPAENTFLILVCNRLSAIPATIRSRCHIMRLASPSTESSLSWLDRITGNREESVQLLFLGDDLPLRAEQLFTSGDAHVYSERRAALQALSIAKFDVNQAFMLMEQLDVPVFLEYFASELRGLLRSLPAPQLKSEEGRRLFEILDGACQLQLSINAGTNPGKQLVVTTLLAKLYGSMVEIRAA